MATQYPTPISLAGSYDSEPTPKKSRNDGFTKEHSFEDHCSKDSKAICRLLSESRKFRESSSTSTDADSRDAVTIPDVTINSRHSATEVDLSVWGYMLSDSNEALSFLLSKESRCGLKKDAWNQNQNNGQSQGVILKDYNGDNLASSGYLIGRHQECDVVVNHSDISERHCVIFKINVMINTNDVLNSRSSIGKRNGFVEQRVFLQDISGRGTYINSRLLKRNEIQLLNDNDQIALARHGPSWTFRRTYTTDHKPFAERFETGRTIGQGHFAEVFEVTEKSTGQRYAAKVIKNKSATNDKGFLQEIGLLMACTHPLITCIRDVFDENQRIYLILELAAGGELFDRIIEKGRFTEDETRHLFKQLFAALHYLHEHSVVHRDIKPENILLVNKDSLDIRLADFGLAKIVGNTTATSTLAGTPSYIPPEMLLTPQHGHDLTYSKKVDSWSAGVVLYICLCGFPPFSQELSPPPLKTQIREGLYQFQRPYWDSISDLAIDLVQHLLTVDPDERFSISQAMSHPFMHVEVQGSSNSCGELHDIDVTTARRGVKRQRTMIQDIRRDQMRDVA